MKTEVTVLTSMEKTNILENPFAIQNEDYKRFDIDAEANMTQDYKLSASLVKKLAIGTHNKKMKRLKKI